MVQKHRHTDSYKILYSIGKRKDVKKLTIYKSKYPLIILKNTRDIIKFIRELKPKYKNTKIKILKMKKI